MMNKNIKFALALIAGLGLAQNGQWSLFALEDKQMDDAEEWLRIVQKKCTNQPCDSGKKIIPTGTCEALIHLRMNLENLIDLNNSNNNKLSENQREKLEKKQNKLFKKCKKDFKEVMSEPDYFSF